MNWSRYRRCLVAIDLTVVIVATFVAYVIRFDLPHPQIERRDGLLTLIPAIWIGCLVVFRTYESRFLGLGSEEFDRVARAATCSVATVATLSWAFKLDIAREFVVLALPASAVLTLLSRYGLRQRLHRRRRTGSYKLRVLLAGHRAGVEEMTVRMRRASYHGMEVTALCVPSPSAGAPTSIAGVPVLGGLADVAEVARLADVDAVAVLPSPELDGAALRRLGWALEDTRTELYVAPSVTEVTGPRVVIRPVVGMPLLHVERPELTGLRRAAKHSVDKICAAVGLVLVAPVLLVIAVAIMMDSPGPVFFRQERVGRAGSTFMMVKFRTMVVNAEDLLADLKQRHDGNDVLFKRKVDPRVTRVGTFLRRMSLDEIPQLLNVLLGDMSLVGPRPPLAAEVALYGDEARRRLLVKPGLTGLWQISGRSDLDWDESVRLDVRYVENWSFGFDFMILWKTVGAVLASRGAY